MEEHKAARHLYSNGFVCSTQLSVICVTIQSVLLPSRYSLFIATRAQGLRKVFTECKTLMMTSVRTSKHSPDVLLPSTATDAAVAIHDEYSRRATCSLRQATAAKESVQEECQTGQMAVFAVWFLQLWVPHKCAYSAMCKRRKKYRCWQTATGQQQNRGNPWTTNSAKTDRRGQDPVLTKLLDETLSIIPAKRRQALLLNFSKVQQAWGNRLPKKRQPLKHSEQ
eukprot:3396272-Amphidinium_carterae.1